MSETILTGWAEPQANDSVSNRIIISRPDQTTTFSGDFSNGTSDASTLASLNRTFAGQDVPLEIFNVGANSQFKTLADLCAYLKEQNQGTPMLCLLDEPSVQSLQDAHVLHPEGI